MNHAYKVFAESSYDRSLNSVVAPADLRHTYDLNKVNIPRIGKFLGFRFLMEARNFVPMNRGNIWIFRVETTGDLVQRDTLLSLTTILENKPVDHAAKLFWDTFDEKHGMWNEWNPWISDMTMIHTPIGTLELTDVRLIKAIYVANLGKFRLPKKEDVERIGWTGLTQKHKPYEA